MPLYTPPGGWCLTPAGNLTGLDAALLYYGSTPVVELIGGILATALRGTGVSATDVHRAEVNAVAASQLPWSQELDEATELLTALWHPSAMVVTQQFNATNAIQRGILRIVHTREPLIQLQAAAEATRAQDVAAAYAADLVGTEAHQRITGDHWVLAAADFAAAAARHDAVVWADHLVGTEAHQRVAGDLAVTARSQAREHLVLNWAQGAIGDLATTTETAVNGVRSDLAAVTAWAGQQITETRELAATDAHEATDRALSVQDDAVRTQLQPVWAGTAASVDATIPQLRAETHAQGLSPVGTSVPATPALALSGIVRMMKPLARATTECALPNCAEKNRLGRQAHDLGSLVGDGLLLAYLTEAIRDPAGAAREVETVGHDIAAPVVDAAKALIGA